MLQGTSILSHFSNLPQLLLNTEEFPYRNYILQKLDKITAPFEFPKDTMLGKQAEACFENLLRENKDIQLLAANVQIQGQKHTLGELDYLFYEIEHQRYVHVELACKFYLRDIHLGNTLTEQWIGPNRKDTLHEKLKKLAQWQFPLLFKSETQNTLSELNIHFETLEQQLCLKTQLFVPYGTELPLPERYHTCIAGCYLRPEQFFTQYKEDAQFALPSKKEWLLPPNLITNWYSFYEIEKQILQSLTEKSSTLVYRKLGETITKFFVVWW
jgi:hypothetical protein